jgi:hypothetical protein
MLDREGRISAAPETLNWVAGDGSNRDDPSPLQDPDVKTPNNQEQARAALVAWLQSGCAIFHITGKPGAGKSTLMKHIATHHKLREDLLSWSGDKSLILARFFFWSLGDRLQRSLEGFHRTVLFQTLKQYPALIKKVLP